MKYSTSVKNVPKHLGRIRTYAQGFFYRPFHLDFFRRQGNGFVTFGQFWRYSPPELPRRWERPLCRLLSGSGACPPSFTALNPSRVTGLSSAIVMRCMPFPSFTLPNQSKCPDICRWPLSRTKWHLLDSP